MLFPRKSIRNPHDGPDDGRSSSAARGSRARPALGTVGRTLIVATAVALIAVGVVTGGQEKASAAKPYHAPRLDWTTCSNLPPAEPGGPPRPKNLQCAKLTVPLDYAKPRGETIQVALIRVRATDRAHRLGSLVFNFGGPGGSGIDAFSGGSTASFKELGTQYDLVGFDPRGVGRSSPVTCADDKQKDAWLAMDTSPDNATERAAFLAAERSLIQGCQQRSGKLLPHVGTISAARDLDVLRASLGERKLNYFGLSYGTSLGAVYAHLFPEKVGRAVLDGAFHPMNAERFLLKAAAFQRALGHFSRWAAQQPEVKARGLTQGAVLTRTAKLLKGLDAKPIPADGGRELTQSIGQSGVLMALYSKDFWPVLLQGIERAMAGDGTILLALGDSQPQRTPDGHYTNAIDAHAAITCADATEHFTERDVTRVLPRFTKASPIFGPTLAWSLTACTGWPFKGDAQRADAPSAPRILVIGTTGDPATPYPWATELARELRVGVLLTFKGEGHTAYISGDTCVHRAVNGYLLKGNVPAYGTTCP
ncbi:alpha/beta hydrolase [Streptomyces sp. NBC_01410]|uniref:alpha/beta hydrolase n=1 Tax=Streptomyces sp. NBC_01410 TaxID=2903856 RepID=UPI0032462E0A